MAALKKSNSRTKSRTRRTKSSGKRGKKGSKKSGGGGGGGILGCCKKKEKRVRVHRGSNARKRHGPTQKSKRDVKRTGQPKSQKSRKSKSSKEAIQKSSKSKREKKVGSIKEKQQQQQQQQDDQGNGKVTLVPPVNQQDVNDQQNDQNLNNNINNNNNVHTAKDKIGNEGGQQDQGVKKMEEKEKKEDLAPQNDDRLLQSPAPQKLSDTGEVQYPSQRFEILQYVENKCYVRKWVYEESVPLSMSSKMRKLLRSSQNKVENCRADKQNRHELYNDLDQLSAIFDAA